MTGARPLDGLLVVDFSQFLAGPYCALRLLDLGARVIKVENPNGGDLCRRLYLSGVQIDADSTLFHAINRGKESVALDLKSPEGLAAARQLVARADVMIQNFRPGVIERLGLGYSAVREFAPNLVYGSISGYGVGGSWDGLPGQDLLAQARSGVMWLSGNSGSGPVPIGLPVADIMAGSNLAHGILAALVRAARTGVGSLVETSLLEGLVDLQFEFLTTYLNNGRRPPERLPTGSAHGYLPAPYGVFETQNGQLVLAMTALGTLGEAVSLPDLTALAEDPAAPFRERNFIHDCLARRLREETAHEWEARLGAAGIWCARVLGWEDLLEAPSFKALQMVSEPDDADAPRLMRAPLTIDGQRPPASPLAPKLGADTKRVLAEGVAQKRMG